MRTEFKKMTLTRALVAGVLCGIITALLIIAYVFFYRTATDFEKINSLGPVGIFIGTPILMVIAASIYFLLVQYVRKGELLYITIFSVLTIAGILMVMNLEPSDGETLLSLPHGLLFGVIAIAGFAICILLPYLAHHPRIYMTSGQMKWEK